MCHNWVLEYVFFQMGTYFSRLSKPQDIVALLRKFLSSVHVYVYYLNQYFCLDNFVYKHSRTFWIVAFAQYPNVKIWIRPAMH